MKIKPAFLIILLLTFVLLKSFAYAAGGEGAVAFILNNNKLCVINADGKEFKVLKTCLPGEKMLHSVAPAWSNDGKKLAFISTKDKENNSGGGNGIWRLNIIDINTQKEKLLIKRQWKYEHGYPTNLFWWPDNNGISWGESFEEDMPYEICYVNVANGNFKELLRAGDKTPGGWFFDNFGTSFTFDCANKKIIFTSTVRDTKNWNNSKKYTNILASADFGGKKLNIIAKMVIDHNRGNNWWNSPLFIHENGDIVFCKYIDMRSKENGYIELVIYNKSKSFVSTNIKEKFNMYYSQHEAITPVKYRGNKVIIRHLRYNNYKGADIFLLDLKNMTVDKKISFGKDNLDDPDPIYNWTARSMPGFTPSGEVIYPKITKNNSGKAEYHIMAGDKSIYSTKEKITSMSVYNKQ